MLSVLISLFISCSSLAEVWVWPGAYRAQSDKVASESVLVLQRHIDRSGVMSARGPSPWAWPVKELTLVFRLESRPRADVIARTFVELREAWRRHGVRVVGLQLDYDSPTSKLADYRRDVAGVLKRLPRETHLSVTGLADWLKLREFDFGRDVTVYFQLYRGAREHAYHEMNLQELERARYPFKLGLLPYQTLPREAAERLKRNSKFKGFTQFYGGTQL